MLNGSLRGSSIDLGDMETPTYIALSKEAAMARDFNVIANNIANASTNGYRAEHMLFQEYLARTGSIGLREKLSFVQDIGTYRDTHDGALVQTNNALDLALQGAGYMVLGDPAQELYTRTGIFHLDGSRQVVTSDGYPLLQENGRPIVIPQGAERIRISGDGIVTTEQGEAGRIRLVRFASEQAMRVAGSGLYATDQAALPATDTKVTQGALESSNIQPVLEVTSMIQMSREYQMVQNLLDSEHTRQQNAFSRITRA
jgi:flagellar basal-body rod protein FlgF